MNGKISFSLAQKKLVKQWLIFSVIVFVIYLIQTLTGKFEGHVGEVWEWLIQNILPPLTLMIGVLISQLSAKPTMKEIDRFYFRMASGISLLLLILLLLSSVLVPFIHASQNSAVLVTEITPENQITIIDSFKYYNTFLIPIQGITTLVLGIFFAKS
jgi:hypothetical protein